MFAHAATSCSNHLTAVSGGVSSATSSHTSVSHVQVRAAIAARVSLGSLHPGPRSCDRRAPPAFALRFLLQICRTRVWTCSTQDGAARGLQRPRGQGDGRQEPRCIRASARSSPVALHTRCIRAPRVCPWARSIASSWRAFTPDETTGASSSLDSNVCYPKCTDPLTLRVHLPDCHSMQRHGKYASSSFRAAFFAPDLSHAGMDL